MKKILSVLLVLSIVLACVLGMSACGKEQGGGQKETETQGPKTYTIEEVAAAAEKMSFTGHGMQTAYCPKCNEEVTWYEVLEDVDNSGGMGGHFFLGSDIGPNKGLSGSKGDVCLFLNGYTFSYDGRNIGADTSVGIAGSEGYEFTVMGKGLVVSANRACAVANSGILNVCGGTYKTLTNTDPCIRTNQKTSQVNIYSARISGGVRLTAGFPDATLKISGDVIMDKLIVPEGRVTIGTLPEGSQVEVEANGVFTYDFETAEAAEAAAKCFVAADDTMKIVVDGKALSCVAK